MLGADIFEFWLFALIFSFALLFFGGAGIQDRETTIGTFGGISLLLLGATAGTILLVLGVIPRW